MARFFFWWKTENKDRRKGSTSKTLTSAPPPEHSQPHSTQLQTTENVCRGSSSLSPQGIPPACTAKSVYIAIKVWHCASWQKAPQTGSECASVSPWRHLITPSVFSALSLEMNESERHASMASTGCSAAWWFFTATWRQRASHILWNFSKLCSRKVAVAESRRISEAAESRKRSEHQTTEK